MLNVLNAIRHKLKNWRQPQEHSGFMGKDSQNKLTETLETLQDDKAFTFYCPPPVVFMTGGTTSTSTDKITPGEIYPGRSFIRIPEGVDFGVVGYNEHTKVWSFRTTKGDFETKDFYEMAAEIANYYEVDVNVDQT